MSTNVNSGWVDGSFNVNVDISHVSFGNFFFCAFHKMKLFFAILADQNKVQIITCNGGRGLFQNVNIDIR